MKHTYIADKLADKLDNRVYGYVLPLGAHGVEVERTEPNEFGAVVITTECDCGTRPNTTRPEDFRSLILKSL